MPRPKSGHDELYLCLRLRAEVEGRRRLPSMWNGTEEWMCGNFPAVAPRFSTIVSRSQKLIACRAPSWALPDIRVKAVVNGEIRA